MQLPDLKWSLGQAHRVAVTHIHFSLEVWLLRDSALGEDGTLFLRAEYCPALSMMGEQAIDPVCSALWSQNVSIKMKMI